MAPTAPHAESTWPCAPWQPFPALQIRQFDLHPYRIASEHLSRATPPSAARQRAGRPQRARQQRLTTCCASNSGTETSRTMHRLLLLACLLAAATGAVAPPPPPLAFVHLSDIHYSTNVRKYWRLFGDREGDAAVWAQQVVPRLRPATMLITGDITDSKVSFLLCPQQHSSASLRTRLCIHIGDQMAWASPAGCHHRLLSLAHQHLP